MDASQLTQKMKQQNLIYAALGAGQLFTMMLMYLLRDSSVASDTSLLLPFQIVAIVLIAGGVGMGFVLYNSRVKQLKDSGEMSIDRKFDAYRTASIIQWALCEAPALFCAIAYYLTGHATFLILFGMALMFFLVKLRPSLENFKRDFAD